MADEPWTDEELEAAVDTYLQMLEEQRSGRPYVKSDFIRELISRALRGRSHKSAEYRMMNISSVLAGLGHETVKGYRPAPHVGLNVAARIKAILRRRGVV